MVGPSNTTKGAGLAERGLGVVVGLLRRSTDYYLEVPDPLSVRTCSAGLRLTCQVGSGSTWLRSFSSNLRARARWCGLGRARTRSRGRCARRWAGTHPDRTMRSYIMQDREAASREATVAPGVSTERNGRRGCSVTGGAT